MASSRPILHLPALAGACAAAYALCLSFVTSQQAQADAAITAARQPLQQGATRAFRQRALTTDQVRLAGVALSRAAAAYDATISSSRALDDALLDLADHVGAATGAAARLPDRVQLPVPQVQVVQVATAAPPAVQAVTGGSGG